MVPISYSWKPINISGTPTDRRDSFLKQVTASIRSKSSGSRFYAICGGSRESVGLMILLFVCREVTERLEEIVSARDETLYP